MLGNPAIPFIRVPDATESEIQKATDIGALGIIVPTVDTVEKAQAAVKCGIQRRYFVVHDFGNREFDALPLVTRNGMSVSARNNSTRLTRAPCGSFMLTFCAPMG